jgi:hypothetical protein
MAPYSWPDIAILHAEALEKHIISAAVAYKMENLH